MHGCKVVSVANILYYNILLLLTQIRRSRSGAMPYFPLDDKIASGRISISRASVHVNNG